MKKELIEQNLQRSILFQDINPSELTSFCEVCRVQIVPEGNFAYRQGDESEVFYIIAMGDAEMVLERKDGGTSIVGRIGPGGHFGETGILTGKPRSVSVRALCDLVLICFDKRVFRNLLLANSRIHRQLDLALAERLRVAFLDQADTACSQRPTTEASGGVEDIILFKEKNPGQTQAEEIGASGFRDSLRVKDGQKDPHHHQPVCRQQRSLYVDRRDRHRQGHHRPPDSSAERQE